MRPKPVPNIKRLGTRSGKKRSEWLNGPYIKLVVLCLTRLLLRCNNDYLEVSVINVRVGPKFIGLKIVRISRR